MPTESEIEAVVKKVADTLHVAVDRNQIAGKSWSRSFSVNNLSGRHQGMVTVFVAILGDPNDERFQVGAVQTTGLGSGTEMPPLASWPDDDELDDDQDEQKDIERIHRKLEEYRDLYCHS